MSILIGLQLFLSLAFLTLGGEFLVRGASRLASSLGVSTLIIGLTIVAFGTSSPELFVSLLSAFKGQGDLAIGNVVGSNIFNILGILGLTALISPLRVAQQILKIDLPLMILCALSLLWVGYSGSISGLEGFLLLAGLGAYTGLQIVLGKKEPNPAVIEEYDEAFQAPKHSKFVDILFIVGGLGILVVSTNYFIEAASQLARILGATEAVIGLSVAAIGTSLPELITSCVAAWKKERDIAVGNIIGSNIFNVLGVLGVSALVKETVFSHIIYRVDLLVMIAASFLCIPVFLTKKEVSRIEGGFFLILYAAYFYYLTTTL